MNDQILAGLEGALKKIERPECWLKRREGETIDGRHVSPNNPDAVRFDLIGSIIAATFDEGGNALVYACTFYVKAQIERLSRHEWLTTFNDAPEVTHADVLMVLRKAIERRREVIERKEQAGGELQSA